VSEEIEGSNTMERRAASMRESIVKAIRAVSRGHVSSYGAIARAAGHPGAARQVVGVLRTAFDLPWHRIVGSGGEIKLRGDSAIEQRLRLEAEGVTFRGRRINMRLHEFCFTTRKRKKRAPRKSSKPGTR
jgi:methylated-DNA-protein-cysteine methyltransferase-like protein